MARAEAADPAPTLPWLRCLAPGHARHSPPARGCRFGAFIGTGRGCRSGAHLALAEVSGSGTRSAFHACRGVWLRDALGLRPSEVSGSGTRSAILAYRGGWLRDARGFLSTEVSGSGTRSVLPRQPAVGPVPRRAQQRQRRAAACVAVAVRGIALLIDAQARRACRAVRRAQRGGAPDPLVGHTSTCTVGSRLRGDPTPLPRVPRGNPRRSGERLGA